MRDLDSVFRALARSKFRRRFRLGARERDYLERRGRATIMSHAADFVDARLAPAAPRNDGRQTPMRNHPVFIAQHATATCCRSCLGKYHGIPRGRELAPAEQRHVLAAIERWLETGLAQPGEED